MYTFSFIKMEGCENDYIFIDTRIKKNSKLLKFFEDEDYRTNFIKKISNRFTGVGGDGLVLITKPKFKNSKARMLMWNADASSSYMCGNALRCIALYEYKKNFFLNTITKNKFNFIIESEKFIHTVKINEIAIPVKNKYEITIEMPYPQFENSYKLINLSNPLIINKTFESENIPLLKLTLNVPNFGNISGYVLYVGNPHFVCFVKNLKNFNVAVVGEFLESHPIFPEKTNVEFVEFAEFAEFIEFAEFADSAVLSDSTKSPESANLSLSNQSLFVRTYERGSKETRACGSGACAAHVVSVITKKSNSKQKVFLLGGVLEIEWDIENLKNNLPVKMKGPADFAFFGTYIF